MELELPSEKYALSSRLLPEPLNVASRIVKPKDVTRSASTAPELGSVTSPNTMSLKNGVGKGVGEPRKTTLGPEIAPPLPVPRTPIDQSRIELVRRSDLVPAAKFASI